MNRSVLIGSGIGAILIMGAASQFITNSDSKVVEPTIAPIDPQRFQQSEVKELAAELSKLQSQLNEERIKRQKLEKKVAVLSDRLGETSSIPMGSERGSSETNEAVSEAVVIPSETETDQVQLALLKVGLTEERIRELKKREADSEMQELFLRDKAIREGWIGTDKYVEERRKLASDTNVYREELGDERYDQYLFETGQGNRVLVQHVISGSPADKAGIQVSDAIYSYDEKRVFSWSELTSATTSGEIGKSVRVIVKRDHQLLDFYIPRGPLGIRLESASVAP
ncbi:MAG: PDZ domain-containing protein [Gammaproteobacteria bacterium]|nr:PDZ domain-containing protein [Gammaproteobacteria bacterium]MDH5693429.1 PDZ domain-containing protein [Gammaproteobacteria bacterium]